MFVAIARVNLEIAVIQASFLGKLDKQKLSNTIINNNLEENYIFPNENLVWAYF